MTTAATAQSLTGASGGSGGDAGAPEQRQKPPGVTQVLEAVGLAATEGLRKLCGIRPDAETRWDGNSSPQETVLTFTDAMRSMVRDGKDEAARIAKTVPPGTAPDSQEARDLMEVFDRLGDIQPLDLPGASALEDSSLQRFEVFPYAVDHGWIWNQLDEPPGEKIVVAKSAAGGWRFTPETMGGAGALREALHRISPVYQQNTADDLLKRMFDPMLERTPWWGWLLLVGSVVVAYFAGRTVRRLLRKAASKFDADTRPIVGSILRSVGTSAAILVGAIIIVIGGASVEFTPLFAQVHWGLVKLVLVIAGVCILFGLTDLVAALVRRHVIDESNEYGEMTVTIIQRVFRSFVFVILAIFLLENVLGLNIGALVAGLGIVGLALSLAGKETAQNLFGAVSIFINRPFVVGDWIEFERELGEVTDVRMQATYIRLLTGEMWIVPNMKFISNPVENLSLRKFLRREMNIAIPYNTEPAKVQEALGIMEEVLTSDEVAKEGKCRLDEKPPMVAFDAFGDYYLNLKVYYWYFIGDEGEEIQRNHDRGWFSYLDHCSMVNRLVLERFNDSGIEFAFPTQTVDLQRDQGGAIAAA